MTIKHKNPWFTHDVKWQKRVQFEKVKRYGISLRPSMESVKKERGKHKWLLNDEKVNVLSDQIVKSGNNPKKVYRMIGNILGTMHR